MKLFNKKKIYLITIDDIRSQYNNKQFFVLAKNNNEVENIIRKHFPYEDIKYEIFNLKKYINKNSLN